MTEYRRTPLSCMLPFRSDIPYKTYTETACILGALSAHFDMPSLLSVYYVNLAAPAASDYGSVKGACPLYIVPWPTIPRFVERGFILCRNASADVFENAHRFIEWILEALSQAEYAFATLNEIHVAGTQGHALSEDYTHPFLIVGCDVTSSTFVAYTYRANGTFGVVNLTFADTVRGFFDRGKRDSMKDSFFIEPTLFAFRPSPLRSTADRTSRPNINDALWRYVNNTYGEYDWDKGRFVDYQCGEELYGILSVGEFLARVYQSVGRKEFVDFRGTRALMEHRIIVQSVLKNFAERTNNPLLIELNRQYAEVALWAAQLHIRVFSWSSQMLRSGSTAYSHLVRHLDTTRTMLKLDEAIMRAVVESNESSAQSVTSR